MQTDTQPPSIHNEQQAQEIKVIKLRSEKGVPVKMEVIERETEVATEEAAKSWAKSKNIFTVYLVEPVRIAYGYPGE